MGIQLFLVKTMENKEKKYISIVRPDYNTIEVQMPFPQNFNEKSLENLLADIDDMIQQVTNKIELVVTTEVKQS